MPLISRSTGTSVTASVSNNTSVYGAVIAIVAITRVQMLIRWMHTEGLVESNGSLLPGGRFKSHHGLTVCTPGSAPGPTFPLLLLSFIPVLSFYPSFPFSISVHSFLSPHLAFQFSFLPLHSALISFPSPPIFLPERSGLSMALLPILHHRINDAKLLKCYQFCITVSDLTLIMFCIHTCQATLISLTNSAPVFIVWH